MISPTKWKYIIANEELSPEIQVDIILDGEDNVRGSLFAESTSASRDLNYETNSERHRRDLSDESVDKLWTCFSQAAGPESIKRKSLESIEDSGGSKTAKWMTSRLNDTVGLTFKEGKYQACPLRLVSKKYKPQKQLKLDDFVNTKKYFPRLSHP